MSAKKASVIIAACSVFATALVFTSFAQNYKWDVNLNLIDSKFGLWITSAEERCPGSTLYVKVWYPVLARSENTSDLFDFRPYHYLIWQSGGRHADLLAWTNRDILRGSYAEVPFWTAGPPPAAYVVYENLHPNMVDLVFGARTPQPELMRWNIGLTDNDISLDEFHAIAACVQQHREAIDRDLGTPIASISYFVTPRDENELIDAYNAFICPGNTRTLLNASGPVEFSQSGNTHTIGYINEGFHFVPVDIPALQAELPKRSDISQEKAQNEIGFQNEFQRRMYSLLPECVNRSGESFTSVYPFDR